MKSGWLNLFAWLLAAALPAGAVRAQTVAWLAPIEAYAHVEAYLLGAATAPDGATAALIQAKGSREDLRVVLYDAGAVASWQAPFPPECRSPYDDGYGYDSAIAFGADGDLYVAANSGFSAAQCVLRLARADGRMVWRHHETRGDGVPLSGYGALVFDPAGNVLVAGARDGGAGVRLTRLDGATGAVQWTYEPVAGEGFRFGYGYGLAIDSLGNAYLAAASNPVDPPFIGSVVVAVRVDTAGAEAWRHALPTTDITGTSCYGVNAPAVTLLDDTALVVGANCLNNLADPAWRQFVLRLRAADGGIAWRREDGGSLVALSAGPARELIATGAFDGASGTRRFDPVSGVPLWTAGPAYPSLHFVGQGKALLAYLTTADDGYSSLRTSELDLAAGTSGTETVVVESSHSLGWRLSGRGTRASVVGAVSRAVAGASWAASTIDVTAYAGTIASASSSAPPLSMRQTQYATPWRRATVVAGQSAVTAANLPHGQFNTAAGAIVVKRDTLTGRERWRRVYERDSPRTSAIYGVAGLPGGDIALIGSPDLLVRLDGASGNERWRVPKPAAYNRADVIGVDAVGDLVVLVWGNGSGKIYVAKYAAADGAERWRVQLPAASAYASQNGQLRFAPNGDVFVVSFGEDGSQPPRFYAARLRAADGAIVWRTELHTALPGAQVVDAATTDGADLIVAGFRGAAAWAARLNGTSGGVHWSVEHAALQRVSRVFVDADGGIVMTAGYATSSATHGWRIARLAADNGAVTWYRELPRGPTVDAIFDLAQAPDGTLLFSGECDGSTALCIAGLAPQDGADRWWFSRPLVGGSTGTRIVQDLAFDARGNLVVGAYANTAATRDDDVTAAQMRILGPWSQDLFADGFD